MNGMSVLLAVILMAAHAHCSDLKSNVNSDGEDAVVENEPDGTVEEFIPTHDWQTVKPGQALPAGLHIRLNMRTGGREAKLLDDDENTHLSVVPESEQGDTKDEEIAEGHERLTAAMEEVYKQLQTSADSADSIEQDHTADDYKYWKKEGKIDVGDHHLSRSELEEALASLKDDSGQGGPQRKFRTMEELKEELGEYQVDVQTDGEIVQELLTRYKDAALPDAERVLILEDLEYYLHQVDNARDFSDMGGFGVLSTDLNHTNADVRKGVAFVIGSAAQSNPPVQIAIIELNVMQKLIQMLAQEKDRVVRQRVLYALSSLVRHFPYAQHKLLQFGGLQVLRELFSEAGDVDSLQLKALTMVIDLVSEQTHALKETNEDDESTHQEKIKQYKLVPIFKHLEEQGWCDVIPPLLDHSRQSSHDEREKILRAMSELFGFCRQTFHSCEGTLDILIDEYRTLVRLDHDGDDYYQNVLNLVEHLRNQLDNLKHSEL